MNRENSIKRYAAMPLAFLAVLPLASLALSQNYDGTGRHELHAEIGLTVDPIVLIYEADLFTDRRDLAKHREAGDLPDSDRWREKLNKYTEADVILDFESTRDQGYLADVANYIRAHDRGRPRKWYRYGMPYGLKSKLEGSIRGSIDKSREMRESPYTQAVDGWAIPCYKRWNFEYIERFRYAKYTADLTGKESIALYWCEYHNVNIDPELRGKPIPIETIASDLRQLIDIYGRVALWARPSSYEPEEQRAINASNRVAALGLME